MQNLRRSCRRARLTLSRVRTAVWALASHVSTFSRRIELNSDTITRSELRSAAQSVQTEGLRMQLSICRSRGGTPFHHSLMKSPLPQSIISNLTLLPHFNHCVSPQFHSPSPTPPHCFFPSVPTIRRSPSLSIRGSHVYDVSSTSHRMISAGTAPAFLHSGLRNTLFG